MLLIDHVQCVVALKVHSKQTYRIQKNPLFNSQVWGLLRLAPIMLVFIDSWRLGSQLQEVSGRHCDAVPNKKFKAVVCCIVRTEIVGFFCCCCLFFAFVLLIKIFIIVCVFIHAYAGVCQTTPSLPFLLYLYNL